MYKKSCLTHHFRYPHSGNQEFRQEPGGMAYQCCAGVSESHRSYKGMVLGYIAVVRVYPTSDHDVMHTNSDFVAACLCRLPLSWLSLRPSAATPP